VFEGLRFWEALGQGTEVLGCFQAKVRGLGRF
jgi:hypothetical protein